MNLINYLKGLLWTFVLMVLLSLWVTLFYYYHILNSSLLNILYLFIPVLTLFIGGFVVGRNSKEKGFLEGLKLGLIYLVIVTLISFLVFHTSFQGKMILYDLILLLTSMLGSMMGINFRKRK